MIGSIEVHCCKGRFWSNVTGTSQKLLSKPALTDSLVVEILIRGYLLLGHQGHHELLEFGDLLLCSIP
jgi:hypothetical protein